MLTLMPRVPNVRPTSIYWLVDTRTNEPFYCGKTVYKVETRLGAHRRQSVAQPRRPLSIRLLECGENVRAETMEVVPPNRDWAERERYWIKTLRSVYQGCLNVTDGGHGAAGMVLSVEQRRKMSAAHTGKKLSPAHCQKMRERQTGKKLSDDTRAKIAASVRGTEFSDERCAKISAAKRGKTPSAETRAKIRSSLMGRPGRKHSDESRAKMRAAKKSVIV